MSFMDQVFEAAHQVNTFKTPNISDFKDKLDDIVTEAGLPSTSGEYIESMQISEDTLYITTSWSVRCCEQTSEYQIPLSILEAPDPMAAAREWKKQSRIKELTRSISKLKQMLTQSQIDLDKADAELKELTGGPQ